MDVKAFFEKIKEKNALDGERRIRTMKEFFELLKTNVLAMEEDPETGEKKITQYTIKVWINHGLSILSGFVTGMGTYWYCGGKFVYFKQQVKLYELGTLASPPSSLWFIMCIIWCAVLALSISAVVSGVIHLFSNVFLIKGMEYQCDIRLTGIAMTCAVYVFVILFCTILHVSILGAYVTSI